jgi:hypothetical protein
LVSVLLVIIANRGSGLLKALANRQEGEPTRFQAVASGTKGEVVAQPATGISRNAPASVVASLASFFPEATPLRIPVQLARKFAPGSSSDAQFSESTVIEFGTPREVLFSCKAPVEFADVLRLRNSDGSLDVEASVVAVQYHPGKTVVAARFNAEVTNWIVKP